MAADQITIREICATFGWTLAEFRAARLLNFPACGYRTLHNGNVEPVWQRADVEAWAASVVALRMHEAHESRA